MRKCIDSIFPETEMLKSADGELQYMVSAGDNRFWLAVPETGDIADLHFVFVFSGRGGTGCRNNISGDGVSGEFRRKMLQDGFAFVCAECSPDAWGDPESTAATVAAAEYCRERGAAVPEKIDLLGFSMGGLGALMFAARHPEKVNRIVDLFGITDLAEFYRRGNFKRPLPELPAEECMDRSPCDKVSLYKKMEILIIHGDDDKIVDIAYSERFYSLLQKQDIPCHFEVIPGVGHTNNILAEAGTVIHRFFRGGINGL